MHSSAVDFDRDSLRRVIAALVADEVGDSRGVSLVLESLDWDEETEWKSPSGPELDSLETFNAGSRVNEFFRLFEVGIEDYLLAYPRLGDWVDVIQKARQLKNGALSFSTSGVTARPKSCAHPSWRLGQDAEFVADRLRAGRVLSLVPPHHVYGFIYTVVMPRLKGIPVEDVRGTSPGVLNARLHPDDVIVGTPFLLRNLLRVLPEGFRGARVLTSTAPMPPDLSRALTSAGASQVIEVYGSSETLGVGWRADEKSPFALFPWWVWSEPGISICHDRTGEVSPLQDSVVTGSCHERTFHVRGRRDRAVQVGGVNVCLETVERMVAAVDGVADCQVRATQPSDGSINRLKAFIVPEPSVDTGYIECELKNLCREQLPDPARPVSWTFGDRLPTNEIGKSRDW